MRFLTIGLLCAVMTVGSAWECTDDLGCQLNGKCVSGKCECRSAWKGVNCSELALIPTPMDSGIHLEHNSTWGGSVIKGSDGKYHMYAAYMELGCGLTSWRSNSIVVHAESNTSTGKFDIKDTSLPAWSHNPSTAVTADGTILLFHVGTANGSTLEYCNGADDCCRNGTSPCGFLHCAPPCNCTSEQKKRVEQLQAQVDEPDFAFVFHTSKDPSGPWKAVSPALPPGVASYTPSPWVHPNGTLYIVFNSDDMVMVRSEHYEGPYEIVTTGACGGGEDPYIYTDTNGNWHCLYHAAPFPNITVAGGHTFSTDGHNWHVSETPAYSGAFVEYEGMSKPYPISKRERPHLIFSEVDGEPIALTSGVTIRKPGVDTAHAWAYPNNNPYPGHYDRSWTHLQYINHPSHHGEGK
eukprot:TRINITY_DN924_c2_g1_i3.p1 TRINITY_DN924_c2_g1~~TRINITY_DN924_c2_g1_i3.p1  ORF type:complete len:408 (+),score=72.04 TRINITY_DN924_c2_g1_i3:65-1288(+)